MFLLTLERHQRGASTLNSKVWRGTFHQKLRYGISGIPDTVVYVLLTRLPYLKSLNFFQKLIKNSGWKNKRNKSKCLMSVFISDKDTAKL